MTGARNGRGFLAAALALVASACGVGSVSQKPFDGPAPSSVLVLPPVARREGLAMDAREFAFGADRAIVARGYRALPLGAGFDLAKRCGVLDTVEPEPDAMRRLQQQVGVDAVLRVEIDAWESNSADRFSSASWDLTWRLLSTETGAQIWSHRLQGHWQKPFDAPDHLKREDGEPEVAMIGATRPEVFRSERELIAALHRSALARMPENVR